MKDIRSVLLVYRLDRNFIYRYLKTSKSLEEEEHVFFAAH